MEERFVIVSDVAPTEEGAVVHVTPPSVEYSHLLIVPDWPVKLIVVLLVGEHTLVKDGVSVPLTGVELMVMVPDNVGLAQGPVVVTV